jgi:ABC-type spermidine/putrescine transport system permease subunit I
MQPVLSTTGDTVVDTQHSMYTDEITNNTAPVLHLHVTASTLLVAYTTCRLAVLHKRALESCLVVLLLQPIVTSEAARIASESAQGHVRSL